MLLLRSSQSIMYDLYLIVFWKGLRDASWINMPIQQLTEREYCSFSWKTTMKGDDDQHFQSTVKTP